MEKNREGEGRGEEGNRERTVGERERGGGDRERDFICITTDKQVLFSSCVLGPVNTFASLDRHTPLHYMIVCSRNLPYRHLEDGLSEAGFVRFAFSRVRDQCPISFGNLHYP